MNGEEAPADSRRGTSDEQFSRKMKTERRESAPGENICTDLYSYNTEIAMVPQTKSRWRGGAEKTAAGTAQASIADYGRLSSANIIAD